MTVLQLAPGPSTDADASTDAQVRRWAQAIEAGVLARAALDDPSERWPGDATATELAALEAVGVRARDAFVNANLGLVGVVVGDFARSGTPTADLYQEGCLGLIAAVERFDHRRGTRFSTYALYWIRALVSTAAARQAGALTIPVSRSEQLRLAHGVESDLAQRLGREPTAAEVAGELGRSAEWTARLLGQRGPRSLDELDDSTLERLAAPRPEDDVDVVAWARRLLEGLSGLERRVLELRLGFDGRPPAGFAATGRALGVSPGRVRRAENRALELLRERCPRSVLLDAAS